MRPWCKAGGKPRYRYTDCGKMFNPLTGTPLSGLHYQDRWQEQARAMLDGVTLEQTATRFKIDYTTAFRWRHRFLAALNLDKPQPLSGIVEADETFILAGAASLKALTNGATPEAWDNGSCRARALSTGSAIRAKKLLLL